MRELNLLLTGGWDGKRTEFSLTDLIKPDLNDEIDQAFENVDIALRDAGGQGWPQVFRVTTYSTDIPSQHERIVANFRKWMPNHCPVWTEIGVKQLGADKMNFEIEVEAHDEEGARKSKA